MAVLCGPLSAVADERPSVSIPRVAEPPAIERYLDGKTIPPGARLSGFVQREPGDGVPVSRETAVYVSYDQQYLYAVFICQDEPARVRARLTRREAIMEDDVVGLLLDPYHDGRRSYIFLTNPLGIQMDGVTGEGQDDDYSYDALWKSDGRLTADGFVVVMAIPFKSLRFANAAVQTWGIAVGRIINRMNETAFWPYITRRINSFGQQMATMTGIEGVSPGRNLQAIPYGNFSGARFLDENGNGVSDASARVGIDAKAVIKDAVTVDLTVRPDFSQVESNEPQVTVNQRFEVYFPEKRPFFIENANYFMTPQNLFFSRRVSDPTIGARVTGKASGWSFGGLTVDDRYPGQQVAAGAPGAGARAAIAVARVQREFSGQSYVGGIVTDREFASESNRVFGLDGRWRINDSWSVTGQWVGSRSALADGSADDGSAVVAEVSRGGRNFEYSGQYLARSPDFRADLGYIERVDMKEVQQEASYSWFPKERRLLRFGTGLEATAVWDYANQLQDWNVEPNLHVEFPGQTSLFAGYKRAYERYEGLDFDKNEVFGHASTQWWKWLNLNGEVALGTAINYYPGPGLQPFLANFLESSVGVTLKPWSRLSLDQTYIYSTLRTRDQESSCGCLGANVPAGTIFSDHILRTRVNYQFTREFSARVILDYEAVRPNTALVDLSDERRLHADVLFTYLVNPWTAVYLGYTDAYENRLRASPLDRPISASGAPLTSVGRQLFLKVSYLLRY